MKIKSIQQNIPSDWKQVKLGDIGVFSKGTNISKEQLTVAGLNAVRYGELYTKHHFQIKQIYSFIPNELASQSKEIKYGDILFAGSGETIDEIGKSAAYMLKEKAYAGGDTIIFTPKNANSLFLSYFLNIGEARKKLRELGQGQSVVHIYKSDIENLRLHLPPLDEQNRIVNLIMTWDKAIDKITKKIEAKKLVKKGLRQILISGKKRLKGYREEWSTNKLREFLVNAGPRNRKLTYSRVLSVTNRNGFILPEEQFDRVVASSDLSNYKIVLQGDFAYNPSRINVGSISRLDNYDNGVLSPMYVVFKTNEKIDSDFFYHWLDTVEANSKIRSCASGSVRESVDFKSFCSIKVKFPDVDEQKTIAHILNTADEEIEELEKKLQIFRDQKEYLLDNLITGTIRTREKLSELTQ